MSRRTGRTVGAILLRTAVSICPLPDGHDMDELAREPGCRHRAAKRSRAASSRTSRDLGRASGWEVVPPSSSFQRGLERRHAVIAVVGLRSTNPPISPISQSNGLSASRLYPLRRYRNLRSPTVDSCTVICAPSTRLHVRRIASACGISLEHPEPGNLPKQQRAPTAPRPVPSPPSSQTRRSPSAPARTCGKAPAGPGRPVHPVAAAGRSSSS